MKLNGVHWLETQVTGFGNLKDEEKSEIIDFCMLWSFFEGEFLNENAGVISIKEFVRNFEKSIDVVKPVLNDCVSYFRGRYVQDTNFTENYRGLNLSRSGNPAEVDMMLTNDDVSDTLKLTGCLIIIFRFRNNLFHGAKWKYNFHGQLSNFKHANELLTELIKLGS